MVGATFHTVSFFRQPPERNPAFIAVSKDQIKIGGDGLRVRGDGGDGLNDRFQSNGINAFPLEGGIVEIHP